MKAVIVIVQYNGKVGQLAKTQAMYAIKLRKEGQTDLCLWPSHNNHITEARDAESRANLLAEKTGLRIIRVREVPQTTYIEEPM